MLRKTDILLAILGVLLLAGAAFSQDDCPAGHLRHPALTALDDASMLAAYSASFRGINGREPSMQPGSGVEDGRYWVRAANHYGVYGDGECHAGWSGYWEAWIASGGVRGDLSLVQAPARFLPLVMAPPAAPPAPQSLPSVTVCDLSGLTVAVDNARADIRALQASVEVFQEQVRSHWRDFAKFLAKYGPLITGAILGGRLTKP